MPTPISGARARLFFNGTTLAGWCTGLRISETIQLQRVNVLGNIDSEEIEPVGRQVTLTADFVRILKSSLQEQGFWPRGGTPEVTNFPEMTAVVYDVLTDEAIYTVEGVLCETRNFDLRTNDIANVNVTMQARRLYDEAGP